MVTTSKAIPGSAPVTLTNAVSHCTGPNALLPCSPLGLMQSPFKSGGTSCTDFSARGIWTGFPST